MFFSFLLQWLVPQVNYWWKLSENGFLSCFSVLKENIQYFNIKYNISFRIFFMNVIDQVEEISSYYYYNGILIFLNHEQMAYFVNAFLKSPWNDYLFFPFILLIWRVALIALRVLNSLAVGINSADPSLLIYFGFGVAVSL